MARPASAATATVSIDPETKPPGKPTRDSPTPPNAAISSVSATGTSLLRGGRTRGIEDFRTLGPHNHRAPLAAFAEINAARNAWRQIRDASKPADRTSICAGNSLNAGAGSRRRPPDWPRAVNGPPAGRARGPSEDILGRSRIR